MEAREYARELRRWGWTLPRIAAELDVPSGTVYGWIRDLPRPPRSVWSQRRRGPGVLERRKATEIAECDAWAAERLETLTDDAFFAAGVALYAGEGGKTDGSVCFVNTDPNMMRFFLGWLRRYFAIDEERLRVRLYLHADLDLVAATAFWSEVTGVPAGQFRSPYRAVCDESRRTRRHVHGCATVRYSCSRTHRVVVALCRALLSFDGPVPRSSMAERAPVKRDVPGSSPGAGACERAAAGAVAQLVRAGDS